MAKRIGFFEQAVLDMQARRAASAEQNGAQKEAPHPRLKQMAPLSERVEKLLKSFTPEELANGIRLESIREQLQGRYRTHAHGGELGAALRRLGFQRVRKWRGDSQSFAATWHKY